MTRPRALIVAAPHGLFERVRDALNQPALSGRPGGVRR